MLHLHGSQNKITLKESPSLPIYATILRNEHGERNKLIQNNHKIHKRIYPQNLLLRKPTTKISSFTLANLAKLARHQVAQGPLQWSYLSLYIGLITC